MSRKKNKKVFVGLSGGVDSSVSAALLVREGYDVTGVFLKVWNPDWMPCNWKEERRDAMRVAARLGIPFMTIDLEREYKQGVVDYMLREYSEGRTPNPDVMCNKEIKFGAFLKKAIDMGADYVATGHYAQVRKMDDGTHRLCEGKDKNKDQSYFLWTLTDAELSRVLFPVGGMTKVDVRAHAERFGLSTAAKKDSQGLCFIGKVDMKEFLSHYIPLKEGDVLLESGERIGRHDGAFLYTLGQRHGFTVVHATPSDEPYYVIDRDMQENTITVSNKRVDNNELRTVRSLTLAASNVVQENGLEKNIYCRFRYRQELQPCTIFEREGAVTVVFKELQASVTPGQSVVLYEDAVCLGGGIIERVSTDAY